MSIASVRRAVLLTLCVALLVPVLARGAEPTDQDRAKAESLYKVALIAIENHDWEIARKKLQEILAIVPDQSRALLRLAEAELNLGRPSAAKKALAKAQAAGLPESDRAAAEDLGPKIDYAIEKQASETPTSAFPRFGWRVDNAGVGTWKSWDEWGVSPALVSGDNYNLLVEIRQPAKSGTEHEVPVDVAVFDQKHEELKTASAIFTNRKDTEGWEQVWPLGEIPLHVSELTVELRSEGKLVVRVRVPVEDAGDPPPASAVQRIAGHWKGRVKMTNERALADLQVSGAGPFPEFTYVHTFSNRGSVAFKFSGRLRSEKGNVWVASALAVNMNFQRSDFDRFKNDDFVLTFEDDGKNGLRVHAPWLGRLNEPPMILTKE